MKCTGTEVDHVAENSSSEAPSLRSVAGLYLRMSRGSRVWLVAALALLTLSLLMHLGAAIAVGKLVDGSIGERLGIEKGDGWFAAWGINQWAFFLIGLAVVNMVSSYFEGAWFQIIGERSTSKLRRQLFDRLMHLPMAYFSAHRSGDLASRVLSDVALLQEGWINDVRNACSYLISALSSVAMLFVISPSLAIFVFLVALPVIAIAIWFGRKIGAYSRLVQDQLGSATTITEEAINGIHRIKTFTNEEYENKKFSHSLDQYLQIAQRVARHRAALYSGITAVLMSASVFLMWYGSRQIQQGKLSPGDFTSFMFFLGFLGNAGGLLAQLLGRTHRLAGATERVVDLLNEVGESFSKEGDEPEKMHGDIIFQNVSFAYPARQGVKVLQDIQLHLEPGKCVAVVGPSGAGKSTLASLLFRLFEPDTGELLIDGKPATEHSLHWIRRQMAMVSQEIMLFNGSVEENIAYGRPDASHEEVVEAARKANVLEFIETLPAGFKTAVGDRGVQFSGGQRQRIAIARAILRDPAVLVLDEATSSLDSENEKWVQEALEDLIQKRTTLIIAHRLSTVRRADKIIVMKDGAIVEQGKHQQLYQAAGFYRQLCDEQQCLFED
ncbi:MAG: ABC transporter ATP-binding protein/permease [Verrucomicrobiales bacterium]|nr:ABC transporter ATP-binding protein/permease [Verrucomicrobiales bacterium]